MSLTTSLRVHLNSKEASCLSWQNTYPNLKTACHIKLKNFLWTKLLENLLLAKYFKSATAQLNIPGNLCSITKMENGEIKNQKTTLTLRMGSNDCAEICEFTRIYILLQSSNLMSQEDSGLYGMVVRHYFKIQMKN